MTATLWRIATDAKEYKADDLNGKGAALTGGRWNSVGQPVVYTSTNCALACLETVVHLNAGGLPLNRYLIEVTVPDDLLDGAKHFDPAADVGWDAIPEGMTSIGFGHEWLKQQRSALLVVPSVIVPEENNVLINPAHPGAARCSARKVRKWLYDPRLMTAKSA